MANCVKCGAPLREGAKFCGACGAKAETQRFCTECGAQLMPGEAFCTECGTPADGAPAPKRRGRPPKNPAAPVISAPKANSKKPDYPDVRGFYGRRYGKFKAVSASDEALVWSDGRETYRLGRDWTLDSTGSYDSIIQTKENILALKIDCEDDSSHMILHTLDKNLRELSQKELCEIPAEDAIEEWDYYMTQFDLFVLQYTSAYDVTLEQDISTGISLRQVDLASGQVQEWKWERLEHNGWTAGDLEIETVDGEQVYLGMRLYKEEDWDDAILIFDPQTGGFSALWQDSVANGGMPLFYDWAKRIMWTHPTRAEQERRGFGSEALVGRKIGPGSPIISNLPVWQKFFSGGYFTYFDGEHAYYAPSYYEFFSYIETGSKSEDWNHTGHGRAETAVVWPQAGKIVMDLMADYWYTIYPMSVTKPGNDELISLRRKDN